MSPFAMRVVRDPAAEAAVRFRYAESAWIVPCKAASFCSKNGVGSAAGPVSGQRSGSVALGDVDYPWFGRDKNFDGLRSDPEYQSIMAGVRGRWEAYRNEFDPTRNR
jgi:hypothetical protein